VLCAGVYVLLEFGVMACSNSIVTFVADIIAAVCSTSTLTTIIPAATTPFVVIFKVANVSENKAITFSSDDVSAQNAVILILAGCIIFNDAMSAAIRLVYVDASEPDSDDTGLAVFIDDESISTSLIFNDFQHAAPVSSFVAVNDTAPDSAPDIDEMMLCAISQSSQ
jgi:hypothetical protein